VAGIDTCVLPSIVGGIQVAYGTIHWYSEMYLVLPGTFRDFGALPGSSVSISPEYHPLPALVGVTASAVPLLHWLANKPLVMQPWWAAQLYSI
jgi:hypothetical protein